MDQSELFLTDNPDAEARRLTEPRFVREWVEIRRG